MNREIKFRAWVKSAGAMATWEQIVKECNRLSIFSYSDMVVMQFIGLKDKNGKEIYEHDVVLWDGRPAIIEYDARMAGYYAMWKGEGVQFHSCQEIVPEHGGLRHIEVIGNIHEHPQLLNDARSIQGTNHMLHDPKEPQAEGQEPAEQNTEATETQPETLPNSEEGNTEG